MAGLRKIKRQKQPPEFLERRWAGMSQLEQAICIKQQVLPTDLLLKKWQGMEPHLQTFCCTWRRLPGSLIEDNWDDMVEDTQRACCKNQVLSLDFIEKRWGKMHVLIRLLVCRHQALNGNFVKKHWSEMTTNQRNGAINFADPLFIHNHWEDLNETQKRAAVDSGFLGHLPPSMLPKYQASKDSIVRGYANWSLRHYLMNLSVDELPDFLTDADPTIRKLASELMEKTKATQLTAYTSKVVS